MTNWVRVRPARRLRQGALLALALGALLALSLLEHVADPEPQRRLPGRRRLGPGGRRPGRIVLTRNINTRNDTLNCAI